MMDTETLWELDRFLCNCKKMMSKIKRQEAMANHLISADPPVPTENMVMAESGDRVIKNDLSSVRLLISRSFLCITL